MRILVYGAGVLGCNLARDFFKAGKDVTLFNRKEGNGPRPSKQTGCALKLCAPSEIDRPCAGGEGIGIGG